VSESTADIIARLQERLRPHAVSAPVTVRRLATDSHAPTGADDYGTRKNTTANRRNGGRSMYYRPKAEDFAGSLPATARPAYGSVKPAGGRKIANGDLEQTRADSENDAVRGWVSARQNLMRDAGDILPAGSTYPRGMTRSGNLAPQARY
jgi:hypothetical protein